MDIKNVSFSGNTRIEKLFCNYNKSVHGENSNEHYLKAILCVKKTGYSKNSQLVNCKNSTIIFNKINCIANLISKFNKIFQQFPSIKWPSERNIEVSFSLHIVNNYGDKFQSDFIPVNKFIADLEQRKNEMKIKLDNDAKFIMTLAYSIECDKNYYGSKCENFCKAMDKESGHYNCTESGQRVCLPGWKGIFCSEANCDNCLNGQCVGPGNCNCYRGWTGNNCEICQKAPGCIHGMCQIETGFFNSSKPQLKAFTCSCNPGWGGQYCDIDLKHCINHPGLCKNNGICHNYYGDHVKHYLCQCAPGFSGRHCQMKTGDCKHDKTPQNNSKKEICQCYKDFSGSYCQINATLQVQINSIENSLKSSGYCVNSEEGYSCSCSDQYGGICKCQFIKCLNGERCIDNKLSHVKCTSSESKLSTLEYFSNFRLENSSIVLPLKNTTESKSDSPKTLDFQYFSSFIFIPLLLGVLIVIAIKFRYKFRRKSRTSIKTIHNDLGIVNNQIKNPVMFTEQRFLLNQRSLLNPFHLGNCKNNLLVIHESDKIQNKSGDTEFLKKSNEDITKSDLLNSTTENPINAPLKNSVICNPNLLINNYKSINESKI